jgi:hypothetical protein
MLLNILSGVAELTLEVINGLLSGSNNEESNNETNNETYKYWSELSYDDQESYFNNNEYLKDYINSHYYPNNREITAKKVQELADKMNRSFTNKYARY